MTTWGWIIISVLVLLVGLLLGYMCGYSACMQEMEGDDR